MQQQAPGEVEMNAMRVMVRNSVARKERRRRREKIEREGRKASRGKESKQRQDSSARVHIR
jgi:hypothetical protein